MEDFERLAKALILRHIFDACSTKDTKIRKEARDFLLGTTKELQEARDVWCLVGRLNKDKLVKKVTLWNQNSWPMIKRNYRIIDFLQ